MSALSKIESLIKEAAMVSSEEENGTVNNGDADKQDEFRRKVQAIVRGLPDGDLSSLHDHYRRPTGAGQTIVRDMINNEIISRSTTNNAGPSPR